MNNYEFKKFPTLAMALTAAALVLAVFAIAFSLTGYFGWIATCALFEIIATVLIIAGLTIGRLKMLRVISMIITVCVLVVAFILAIYEYEMKEVTLFALSLLMLIACVLELAYFIAIKKANIKKMYIVTSFVLTFLTAGFTFYYLINGLIESGVNYQTVVLLVSFIFITFLPASIQLSLSEKEVENEPTPEVTENNE